MIKNIPGIVNMATMLLIITMMAASLSYAQQSTEQFIPIGQSPGISAGSSYIGRITAVDRTANTFVVESNSGAKTIKVVDSTRFWLDRSKSKKSSLVGSYADCEVGRMVEVKHDGEDKTIADWVKIEST